LIWDRLGAHLSKKVGLLLDQLPRLQVHLFPPYAPELNPVENLWSYWKLNPLANFVPMTLEELSAGTTSCGRSIQRRRDLLWSFVEHSPLKIERMAA
jgi:putative transposase